jgi:hypothetical protein
MAFTYDAADVSWYCVRCGYNLRGLAGAAVRCPECGKLNARMQRFVAHPFLPIVRRGFRIRQASGWRAFDAVAPRSAPRQQPLSFRNREGMELMLIRPRAEAATRTWDLVRGERILATVAQRQATARSSYEIAIAGPPRRTADIVGHGSRVVIRAGSALLATAGRMPESSLRLHQVEMATREDMALLLAALVAVNFGKDL